MKILRRTLEHWTLYGIPRCAAFTGCRRLLWPWFDIGGDGESALCRACTRKLREQWEREDREFLYP